MSRDEKISWQGRLVPAKFSSSPSQLRFMLEVGKVLNHLILQHTIPSSLDAERIQDASLNI